MKDFLWSGERTFLEKTASLTLRQFSFARFGLFTAASISKVACTATVKNKYEGGRRGKKVKENLYW
jgi:hypothetical protein